MNSINEIFEEMLADNLEEKRISVGEYDIDRSIFKENIKSTISFDKVVEQGRMISVRKHTRYIHYPEHKHDYVELNYILSGKSTQIVGEEEVSLKRGDLLFMGLGMSHEIFPCEKEDIIINFIIKREFFKYIFEFISGTTSLSNFLVDAVFKSFSPKALIFETIENKEIQELINKITMELKKDGEFEEVRLKFLIGLLVVELMKLDAVEINRNSYDRNILLDVLTYIEKNYRDATLNEISESLNLKNYNLAKLIKKECNLTFKELVKEVRIKKISELLLSSNLSINDLAEEVGFCNSSHFYKIFKGKYGISPKEFRNLAKNKIKEL